MDLYSILILSCSHFSDMWSNDLCLFERYWPNHAKIVLASDDVGTYDNVKPQELRIYTGDMSDRLIHSLEDIDTKYVLLTFDDYYLKKQVDSKRIEKLIDEMDSTNTDYCRIFRRPFVRGKKEGESNYRVLPLNKVYQVNFYPCIWKRESALKVLRSGETIWKTEARLTRRARENKLRCIYISDNSLFPFKDIVRKGKYLITGKRFIKANKLFLSNRKTRTIKETLSLFFRTAASKLLPNFIKEPLKRIMRKKGKIIYSDYENTDD